MARNTSKAPARKRVSRLTAELLEMASAMHATGLLPDTAYDKITMRHMGKDARAAGKGGQFDEAMAYLCNHHKEIGN